VGVGQAHQAPDLRDRAAAVDELADGLAQEDLLLGESEIHGGSARADRPTRSAAQSSVVRCASANPIPADDPSRPEPLESPRDGRTKARMAIGATGAWTMLALALIGAGGIAFGLFRIARLSRKQKKLLLKRRLRHAWRRLEQRGLVAPSPVLVRDPRRLYPALALLEQNYRVIRKECLELMARPERIPHIRQSGGRYTKSGIHEVDWRTFMLKSGRFLEANCAHAPETTRLLRQIPGVATAFFSILGPGQHLRAHWGYYKGFLRYHLGLVIPDDNRDERCWLRVNDDPAAYDQRRRSVIEETPKYYWHEGEGVVFDDTCLHDAANESDRPRAVLFLDLIRPLPWYLHVPNVAFVWLAQFDPTLREIRREAVMRD